MIFVTTGTHEQQFNRLIEKIDELKSKNIINEDVFIQTGYSDYKPKYCDYKDFISYKEMNQKINESRIVITHGGPSSFMEVLQVKKIPLVVPRLLEYKEHVNNHQLEFVKKISELYNNIIPIYDINKLEYTITNYDNIVSKINKKNISHNKEFCEKLEKEINEMLG